MKTVAKSGRVDAQARLCCAMLCFFFVVSMFEWRDVYVDSLSRVLVQIVTGHGHVVMVSYNRLHRGLVESWTAVIVQGWWW